ncbi:MAG: Gfo/Idh/MocA family oxidoreductase, partial [Planctomycetes bacterium]|nr:Gfo/Idh/MocA family oxidoreductase [Planctomycetota bacterium]
MPPLNVAIAGTGFMGPVHAEALRRAGQNVVGVLGSSPEKSHVAAETWGGGHAYSTYAELLADPRVEAVHITTPNRLHFEMASAALRAEKHVICEKPLAMNSRESAALVELAAASHVVAAVAYNIRYYPLCLEVRDRLSRQPPNRIWHVQGSYTQDWL